MAPKCSIVWISHIALTQSSVGGHLGCTCLLVVRNRAAGGTDIQVSICVTHNLLLRTTVCHKLREVDTHPLVGESISRVIMARLHIRNSEKSRNFPKVTGLVGEAKAMAQS